MAGSPRLRETIAAGMRGARLARVTSGDVLITNGSQQALELVFRTLLDRGDAVVLEDPTFTRCPERARIRSAPARSVCRSMKIGVCGPSCSRWPSSDTDRV